MEFVSLGPTCVSSWYLKELGLKRASYPFDWVFVNLGQVLQIIRSDFHILLDKSKYCDWGGINDPEKAGHAVYGDKMFNHRNPRLPDDYKYLERCVARFKNLSQCENVCFLYMTKNPAEPPPEELCFELSKTIKHFRVVIIRILENQDLCDLKIADSGRWHRTFDFRIKHTMDGLKFNDPKDESFFKEEFVNLNI